jgi:hypothetical protein
MKSIFLSAIILLWAACNPAPDSGKMLLHDREGFHLEYPSSWKIDTKDEDYDPDALFSIDSPRDGGMIMFIMIDMDMDPDELLTSEEEAIIESVIKKPTSVTSFKSWGNFSGKGKTIKGKLLGLLKGQVNIFIHVANEKTLVVMEQYYDNDADEVIPDLKKIAASFRLKKPPVN